MPTSSVPSPVALICILTYNQAPYIRSCLEGMLMQQTSFPYLIVVHDDASTDGTTSILHEYQRQYPDKIELRCEAENRYSKEPNAWNRFLFECIRQDADFVAICEGDDCWVDPHKLQKQVDFLSKNQDYTLVCCDAHVLTPAGELDWKRADHDCDLETSDMITQGGAYICTSGIVFRNGLLQDYPTACFQCSYGDYPIQIFAALKGKIRYMSSKMIQYHYLHENSWSVVQGTNFSPEKISKWKRHYDMMRSLDAYSHGLYNKEFKQAISASIMSTFVDCGRYLPSLRNEIRRHWEYLTPRAKILYFIFRTRIPALIKRLIQLFNNIRRNA